MLETINLYALKVPFIAKHNGIFLKFHAFSGIPNKIQKIIARDFIKNENPEAFHLCKKQQLL